MSVFPHSFRQTGCHRDFQNDLPDETGRCSCLNGRNMDVPGKVDSIGAGFQSDPALPRAFSCGIVSVEKDIPGSSQKILFRYGRTIIIVKACVLGASGSEELYVDIFSVDLRPQILPGSSAEIQDLEDHGHAGDLDIKTAGFMGREIVVPEIMERRAEGSRQKRSLLFKEFVMDISADHGESSFFVIIVRRAPGKRVPGKLILP